MCNGLSIFFLLSTVWLIDQPLHAMQTSGANSSAHKADARQALKELTIVGIGYKKDTSAKRAAAHSVLQQAHACRSEKTTPKSSVLLPTLQRRKSMLKGC